MEEDAKRPAAAAAATGIGGALMAVGAVLPFVKVGAGQLGLAAESVSGIETDDGKLYLFVGLALVVFAVVMWVVRSVAGRRILATLALLAGGLMVYAGIVDVTGIEDQGLEAIAEAGAAEQPGVTAEQVRAALEQLGVTIDAGFGLYVVLAGAVLGAVGGILGLVARGGARPAPPPPPPPPGAAAEPPRLEGPGTSEAPPS